MRNNLMKLLLLPLVIVCSFSYGHGWTDYPKARQTICADDGGYWSSTDGSTIPNAACRAAFLQSGTYPFVQKNEFSANVIDYLNQGAVEAVVTDGDLCSAGATSKSGMDIPSAAWQKTVLQPGSHTLRFRATAPHNPSFWRIYLTRSGFDSASQRLNWSDLELINSYDNLPVVNGFYEMDINIPSERSGTGILYVRWQRYDAGGEGFYNCSDLAFSDDATTTPPPGPDPDPSPNLVNIGSYVTSAHDIAEVNDTVRFRLFNSSGQEVVDESIVVTAGNLDISVWARDLALKVNDIHSNQMFIGIWHEEMNHLMYDEDNVFSNRVWATDTNFSYSTSVIKSDDQPPVTDYDYAYPEGLGSYQPATKVKGTDGNIYQCKPFPDSGWCNLSSFYYAPGTGLAWQDAWIRL
ncbi:lytic polysaccharide monooxygenase [Endozoicomonas lisbonensis]|uniref:Carbohydrate-binding protein with CBM5 and CBM33 domain n=1 Tax=Endozoicomonas lisbonensis TaxID=3120522 RepID=A0ABV2SB58_9GAMM